MQCLYWTDLVQDRDNKSNVVKPAVNALVVSNVDSVLPSCGEMSFL
jgi:hypothetical protein